jgi:hypothetical protein
MMGLSSANAPALDLPARFMALSISALVVLAVSAPWSLPLVQGGFSDFSLLAIVHLATLGFIGSMIIGASYQLVPVAIGVRLSSVSLGRASFWFYGSGLALFLLGLERAWLAALAIGASLLGAGFLLYIGVIVTTWWRAPHQDVVAWHIGLASLNAGIGMSFGVLLAFNKQNGVLGDRLLHILAAHIAMMLVGWVALTFTGVAYRLIGMFTLSESHFRPWLAWAELAGVAGGAWLLALQFLFDWPAWTGQVAALALVAGFACFVAQIGRLYRRRMRRTFDIHVPFALAAAGAALTAAILLTIGLFRSMAPNDPIWVAVIWLGVFGTAGTAIQGFFYKIATFLVWLKRYAPVAGRETVPKLEQLYDRRIAVAGWGLWTSAIVLGGVAILAGWGIMAMTGVVLFAGVACFTTNVVMIARHWFPMTGIGAAATGHHTGVS